MTVHDRLVAYLQEMHAFQEDVAGWATTAIRTTTDPVLASALEEHRGRTERLVGELAARLEGLGEGPSAVKRAAFRTAALAKGIPYRLRSEKTAKNLRDAYITAAMASSGFALLRELALRDGDDVTAALAERGRAAQEPLREFADGAWGRALGVALAEEGIAAG